MTPSHAPPSSIVVVDSSATHLGSSAYKGYHALVPILIGVSLPIVLFSIFDPRALTNFRLVLHFMLAAIALVAAAVFFLSVTNPGNVVQITFDAKTRRTEIVRAGAFANKVVTVPFDRVAAVRFETAYDDDGYQSRRGLMVLKSRDMVELPDEATEDDLAEIRRMIGLA